MFSVKVFTLNAFTEGIRYFYLGGGGGWFIMLSFV